MSRGARCNRWYNGNARQDRPTGHLRGGRDVRASQLPAGLGENPDHDHTPVGGMGPASSVALVPPLRAAGAVPPVAAIAQRNDMSSNANAGRSGLPASHWRTQHGEACVGSAADNRQDWRSRQDCRASVAGPAGGLRGSPASSWRIDDSTRTRHNGKARRGVNDRDGPGFSMTGRKGCGTAAHELTSAVKHPLGLNARGMPP